MLLLTGQLECPLRQRRFVAGLLAVLVPEPSYMCMALTAVDLVLLIRLLDSVDVRPIFASKQFREKSKSPRLIVVALSVARGDRGPWVQRLDTLVCSLDIVVLPTCLNVSCMKGASTPTEKLLLPVGQ